MEKMLKETDKKRKEWKTIFYAKKL